MSDRLLIETHDERKRELIWAMQSRLLTPAEMEEVHQLGNKLVLVPWDRSYHCDQSDLRAELHELLWQQFRFRAYEAWIARQRMVAFPVTAGGDNINLESVKP